MKPGAADLYDYIYSWKDYAGEAGRVADMLEARGVGSGATLLEVACGTARYLEHLRGRYRVQGVDLDPEMVRQAQWRVPEGVFWVGDMARFSVPTQVDGVLALFGAVGYLAPEGGLEAGMARIAAAVRPGGVVLVEPWITPDRFAAGQPWMQIYEAPNFKLARLVVPEREGERCVLAFHYQVARSGGRVDQLVATERLWLHPLERVVSAAEGAGLSVELTQQGFMTDQHLLICQRT